MTNLTSATEQIYTAKALLEHKVDTCKALFSSCLASSIAWFALYLSKALSSSDTTMFAIFAILGCIILPTMAYTWYQEGKRYTVQIARLSAEIADD